MSIRFAPSPTGTFHLGNLRTAWISHEFARQLGRDWVVRFEDIDRPRVVAGAQEKQLADLRALGLEPDRIVIQSESYARHEKLFSEAVRLGVVYPCNCSRKEILESLGQMASAPHSEVPIYDGHCRNSGNSTNSQNSQSLKTRKQAGEHPTLAWRFLNPKQPNGTQDFIVARTNADGSDFVPSYHWACAIDDYDGDHSLLVRAWDLAHVIPQQRQIFEWVGHSGGTPKSYPAVFHCSLVVQDDGHRLEKRTRGVTLDEVMQGDIDAAEIIRRFTKSFDAKLITQFKAGLVWGEASEEKGVRHLFGPNSGL